MNHLYSNIRLPNSPEPSEYSLDVRIYMFCCASVCFGTHEYKVCHFLGLIDYTIHTFGNILLENRKKASRENNHWEVLSIIARCNLLMKNLKGGNFFKFSNIL